jgi:hypothetical protein
LPFPPARRRKGGVCGRGTQRGIRCSPVGGFLLH